MIKKLSYLYIMFKYLLFYIFYLVTIIYYTMYVEGWFSAYIFNIEQLL